MDTDKEAGTTARAVAPPRRLALSRLGAGALSLGLAGCDLRPERSHDGPDAPRAAPLLPRPRLAWVLSSGGPRGFVHVGVLKALHEAGHAPDVIVGASVGAMVGVLHAGGHRGQALAELAMAVEPWQLAELAIGGQARFSGSGLADWVRERLPAPLLERLPMRAVCVARRLQGPPEAALVALSEGDAGIAVQASAAIQGQFTPVRVRGEWLADADDLNPLPVRLARALGAERVLAVDASAHEDRAPPGAERYRAQDLRKRALTRPDAERADLLLHPDIGYWTSISREYRLRCIAAGEAAVRSAAARIAALHAPAG